MFNDCMVYIEYYDKENQDTSYVKIHHANVLFDTTNNAITIKNFNIEIKKLGVEYITELKIETY